MKHLAFIISSVCLAAFANDMFVYSADAKTEGSGERECPAQGVNLATGAIVIGLNGLTDTERAACGWYRVTPYSGTIGTNEIFTCTGHVFRAEGTAERIGRIREKPKTYTRYSKLKAYTGLCLRGKWNAAEDFMKSTTISNVNFKVAWDNAQYLADDSVLFTVGVEAAREAIGMTKEEMSAFLKECEDGHFQAR